MLACRVPELPELTNVRGMFASKFGKKFVEEAMAEQEPGIRKTEVDERLVKLVSVEPPSGEDKFKMLQAGTLAWCTLAVF